MTIFVVTHDMNIARRTHRVLVMKDGRIEREDVIGKPFEEDLKAFKHSGLGRALLSGEIAEQPIRWTACWPLAIRQSCVGPGACSG